MERCLGMFRESDVIGAYKHVKIIDTFGFWIDIFMPRIGLSGLGALSLILNKSTTTLGT